MIRASADTLRRYGLVALAFLHIGVTHSYVVPFWLSLACLVVSVFIVLASSRIVKAQRQIEGN